MQRLLVLTLTTRRGSSGSGLLVPGAQCGGQSKADHVIRSSLLPINNIRGCVRFDAWLCALRRASAIRNLFASVWTTGNHTQVRWLAIISRSQTGLIKGKKPQMKGWRLEQFKMVTSMWLWFDFWSRPEESCSRRHNYWRRRKWRVSCQRNECPPVSYPVIRELPEHV